MLRPARPFPPDLGIVGTVENLRQLLFDLAQTVGAQLESRLIDGRVLALFRETGIQAAEIGDFLAKAGEVFRDIWHLFPSYALFDEPPVNSAAGTKVCSGALFA